MAFFGPGVTLNTKPKWRQSWWWKERLPGIIALLVVVVLALVVGWVTVALSDGDDSGAKPSTATGDRTGSTESRTPVPTRPRETPPKRPEAISEPTVAGLEATVRHHFDAANYAQRTGDVEPIKQVYDLKSCSVCRDFVSNLKNLTKNGRYVEGASYRVESFSDAAIYKDNTATLIGSIEARINGEKGRQLEADGSLVEEFSTDRPSVSELRFSFQNGSWRILSSRVKELG